AMIALSLLLLVGLFVPGTTEQDEFALFVRVLSPATLAYTYEIIPAMFGPDRASYQHVLRNVRLEAASLSESCNGLEEDMTGKVVIMPRGECSFMDKVAHAEAANALFALITEANSSSTTTISMSRGDDTRTIHTPSAYIAGSSGSRMHRYLTMSNEPVLADLPINGTDIGILYEKAPWEIW
ncbi:hypothetical protein PFISCL1PPCAC_4345, partial [Pristionchus fissidentatus]